MACARTTIRSARALESTVALEKARDLKVGACGTSHSQEVSRALHGSREVSSERWYEGASGVRRAQGERTSAHLRS